MPDEPIRSRNPAPPVERLAGALRDAIAAGRWRPGEKLPPISELARREGVTQYQAREAVLRLSREGLLTMRQGAGTFVAERAEPAAGAATGAERGDVLLLGFSAGDDQSDRLADAIGRALEDSPFRVRRPDRDHEDPGAEAARRLAEWAADPPRGVVCRHMPGVLRREIRRVCGPATTVVGAMGDLPEEAPFHRVLPDTRAARELAAERLVRRGHRRIGMLVHRRADRPGPIARTPVAGRDLAVAQFGRAVRARLGRGALTVHRQRGRGAPHVDELVAWLNQPDPPTAVYGADFRIAQLIRAAERAGRRVPEELEVLGQGNTVWAEEFDFPSIDLRLETIARHVAALLLRAPRELEATRAEYLVAPRLVERGPRPDS